MALVVFKVIEDVFGNDIEVVDNVSKSRVNIEVPISGSISDNETLEVVDLVKLLFPFVDHVVLMDLPREVRHVDASVGFTSDPEGVL